MLSPIKAETQTLDDSGLLSSLISISGLLSSLISIASRSLRLPVASRLLSGVPLAPVGAPTVLAVA